MLSEHVQSNSKNTGNNLDKSYVPSNAQGEQ